MGRKKECRRGTEEEMERSKGEKGGKASEGKGRKKEWRKMRKAGKDGRKGRSKELKRESISEPNDLTLKNKSANIPFHGALLCSRFLYLTF